MEEILAFVLGVSVVALIWAVTVAFRTLSKVRRIERLAMEQQLQIADNNEIVHRRVDQEIDRADRMYEASTRYIDSRVDKLEQKILLSNQDSNKSAKKELIKG